MTLERDDFEREGSPAVAGSRLDPAELAERQQLYQGFGETLALAFEVAFTPVIIGFMGYGLDRWLGTLPILTIVFAVLAVVGMSVRLYYGYEARMKVQEASAPWARTVLPTPATPSAVSGPDAAPSEAPAPEAVVGEAVVGEAVVREVVVRETVNPDTGTPETVVRETVVRETVLGQSATPNGLDPGTDRQ